MKDGINKLLSLSAIGNLAFISLIVKIVLSGASIGDALALIGVAGLIGYNTFLTRKDDEWKRHIERELIDIKNSVTSVKINQNVKKMHSVAEKPESKRYF